MTEQDKMREVFNNWNSPKSAEEFVRRKLSKLYPKNQNFNLANEFISVELAKAWIEEFNHLINDPPTTDVP